MMDIEVIEEDEEDEERVQEVLPIIKYFFLLLFIQLLHKQHFEVLIINL